MSAATRFMCDVHQWLGRAQAHTCQRTIQFIHEGISSMPTKTQTKREEYTAKMKLQLDELNAKMNELETKTKEAKADAREKYKSEVAKLRQQSELAVAKLNEVAAAGEDTWEKMVDEMEKVRDAFTSSFHYFQSKF